MNGPEGGLIVDRAPARNRRISREFLERLRNIGASEETLRFTEGIIRRQERADAWAARRARGRALLERRGS